jgi:hypothetical protein
MFMTRLAYADWPYLDIAYAIIIKLYLYVKKHFDPFAALCRFHVIDNMMLRKEKQNNT